MQPDRTEPRRDVRVWQNCAKYGTRLRRQAGTDTFKSTVSEEGRERVKHFYAQNWTQARRLHEQRLVKVRDGREHASSNWTMEDLAHDFFTYFEGLVASDERAPRTLEKYRSHYRIHLAPFFGRMKVQAIRASQVSAWLAAKRRQGIDVHSVYATLSTLLNHALSREVILDSPLKRLAKGERPKQQAKNPPRCLTDDECSALILNSLPATRTLNAFLMCTGARQSEALGLFWEDLELPKERGEYGSVRIHRQLERRKRGDAPRRVPLKSARRRPEAAEREVDLHPDLVDLLKIHRAQAFSWGTARPDSFVFATASGEPLYYRNASRDLDKAASRAGLNDREDVPKLSTHDLRHTAISRWIAHGLDPATVAAMAGDRVDVILSTYVHEFQRANRKDDIRAKLTAGTNIRLAVERGEP